MDVLLGFTDSMRNEDPIPEPPVAGSRTVLAYLAADHRGTLNNLSSLALLDLEEMRLGMAKVNNSSNMRLLVYIDTDSSPRLIELKMKVVNCRKQR